MNKHLVIEKFLIDLPRSYSVFFGKVFSEESCMAFIFEGRPITAYITIVCNNRLEDSAVVMGTVSMLRRKNHVTALVTD